MEATPGNNLGKPINSEPWLLCQGSWATPSANANLEAFCGMLGETKSPYKLWKSLLCNKPSGTSWGPFTRTGKSIDTSVNALEQHSMGPHYGKKKFTEPRCSTFGYYFWDHWVLTMFSSSIIQVQDFLGWCQFWAVKKEPPWNKDSTGKFIPCCL